MVMRFMRWALFGFALGLVGYVAGFHFAVSVCPTSVEYVRGSPEYDAVMEKWSPTYHAFTSVEDVTTVPFPGILGQTVRVGPLSWTEQDFQALFQWERDGIFPRLGYDRDPPGWYEVEKTRRGIVVTPERIVTPEEFGDPEFERRHNR